MPLLFPSGTSGHCKKLAPKWDAAAEQLKGRKDVTFANVDCTAQKKICSDEGVTQYPFLIKYNAKNMKGEVSARTRALICVPLILTGASSIASSVVLCPAVAGGTIREGARD